MKHLVITFSELLKKIASKISDWILLAYVIWFIKAEEMRSKAEKWTYGMNDRVKDRD